jgi:hypothetical protein
MKVTQILIIKLLLQLKNNILIILLFLVEIFSFHSCTEERNKEINNSKEEIISCKMDNLTGLKKCTSYYMSGGIHFIKSYRDSLIHGEIKEFYESGKVKMIGKYSEGVKVGMFEYFRDNGTMYLAEHYEFSIIDNTTVLSQYIYYDQNEQPIMEKSHYYHIKSKDTILLGEKYIAKIKLEAPYNHSKMQAYLNIFKGDLSDLAKNAKGYKYKAEDFTINYSYKDFPSSGKYYLIGYIDDYKDSVIDGEKTMLSNRLFIVKEIHVLNP